MCRIANDGGSAAPFSNREDRQENYLQCPRTDSALAQALAFKIASLMLIPLNWTTLLGVY